jgi:hypothetical protein
MAANEKSSGSRPRVNFLRRRPRPGALVRPGDGLPLPHERDQTEEGMTDGQVPAEGKVAHDDAVRGVPDTSKAPEMERAYRNQKS